jgi:hypothetical protein
MLWERNIMNHFIRFSLIIALGFAWGCGDSDVVEHTGTDIPEEATFGDRDDLNQRCDSVASLMYNSDALLSCESAFADCTNADLFVLVNTWECTTGESLEGCPTDESGEPITDEAVEPIVSEACQEVLTTLEPMENSLGMAVGIAVIGGAAWVVSNYQSLNASHDITWMYNTHRLAGTNWCGPGDAVAQKFNIKGGNGVDGACRRHDHGREYETQNVQTWFGDIALPGGLPRAWCGVDFDITSSALANRNHSNSYTWTPDVIQGVFGNSSPFACKKMGTCQRAAWCSCGSWCPGYPCLQNYSCEANVRGGDKWSNSQMNNGVSRDNWRPGNMSPGQRDHKGYDSNPCLGSSIKNDNKTTVQTTCSGYGNRCNNGNGQNNNIVCN